MGRDQSFSNCKANRFRSEGRHDYTLGWHLGVAQLLQRFTGLPAHAMVASVHNDQDIQAEIDAGDVHWYTLNPNDFTPE